MKKSILQLVKTGIISSFLFAMVIRCLAQPVADFTYALTNGGCAPDSVVFTNTSTGANAYFWDFGDFGPNDTSTAVNPFHIYLWNGTFTVTLTAYDTLTGNSDQTIQILTINFTPWPGWAWFWANPNPVCPGDPMDFSTFMFPPPTSMLWDFDDGDSSTLFSPSHIYADTGIYNVTLIAGNSCGSDTVTSPVSVYDTAAIFASFWASLATACPGQPVEFSNFSSPTPASSLWLFGDGDSATTFNAYHAYADTGSYTVTLIVYSSCNSDTATTTVTIDTSLIPFVSTSASPNPVCPDDVVSFSGSGNNLTSFLWDFDDGGNSLQEDPAHSFTDTGTYTVVFTATNYCGNSNSDTVIVVVGDSVPPVWVSFWTNPWSFCSIFSNICPGTIVRFINNSNYATSFYWDFGDGNTSTLEEPTHVFANTGTYDVKLIGTSSCGGVDSIVNCVYVVNDAAPSAWFCTNPFCFPSSVVCPGSPVFFQNWSSDTTNSFWDFGDGDTSVLANPTHVFTDTGSYTVVLKVTNNCGNVAYHVETITVTYNAAPAGHYINAWPSIVCPGENINFQILEMPFFFPVDTADVLWNFGDGNTSTTTNPSYAYDSSGSFTVTLIVYTTCGNDTTIREITVKPGSSPDFTYTLGCAGDTIFFTDASTPAPGTWAWDFGDGDTSTVQNPTHIYPSDGTYKVCLVVSNICGFELLDDTICKFITLSAVGIDEFSGNKTLTVYPNPTKNVINVSLSLNKPYIVKLSILNNLGQEVWSSGKKLDTGQHEINIKTHNLTKGIYFVKIHLNNKESWVGKFVKID
ncbi:MAG: PKD domain-containing protein [Cytophagales bacterium]|nr:PKD domain-containing protein [Cytophagales bacterium]